jgi:hypothetical protein
MTNTYTQVNSGLKTYARLLFESFCAARVACPLSEKAFNGFYFAIVEGIILGVADGLVIGCSDIVDGECTAVLNNNFRKFNFFKEL